MLQDDVHFRIGEGMSTSRKGTLSRTKRVVIQSRVLDLHRGTIPELCCPRWEHVSLIIGGCIVLIHLLSPSTALSAEMLSLSMWEAVQIGLERNRQILQASEELTAANAALAVEFNQYTPKQTFEGSTGRVDGSSSIQLEGVQGTTLATPFMETSRGDVISTTYKIKKEYLMPLMVGGRLTFELGLENSQKKMRAGDVETTNYVLGPLTTLTYRQPLTPSGRIAESSVLVTAHFNHEKAQAQFRQAQEQAVFDILTAYDALLKAIRAREIEQEAVRQLQEQVNMARVQAKAGVLAEIELLKLEVQLAIDQNNLVEAETREQNEHESLRNHMGLQRGIRIQPVTVRNFQIVDFDIDQLHELAKIHRPDLHMLHVQQKINALEIQKAKSFNHPFLTAKGVYSGQNPQNTFQKADDSLIHGNQKQWAILVGITFPFFDGGGAKASTQKAIAEATQQAIAVEALEQNIMVEIEESVREVQSAARRFKIAETSLSLAREVLQIDQMRFSRGLITTTDFLRSQLFLSQLNLDINNASIDHHLSVIRLFKATGTLLENLDTIAHGKSQ